MFYDFNKICQHSLLNILKFIVGLEYFKIEKISKKFEAIRNVLQAFFLKLYFSDAIELVQFLSKFCYGPC